MIYVLSDMRIALQLLMLILFFMLLWHTFLLRALAVWRGWLAACRPGPVLTDSTKQSRIITRFFDESHV